ncbi:MAG: hypothetical protein O8C62_09900 [Candidatus Methanoperedens sp.]|nr:hypothetical protein [Candidatus Methanoperedens sp.]
MKVAVVSSDGKVINQHFGKASRFLIFEVDNGKIRFIEERANKPVCGSAENGHSDNALGSAISLIMDCKAVLCARIGGGAEEELIKSGISPVEAPYLIDEALIKYERWIR